MGPWCVLRRWPQSLPSALACSPVFGPFLPPPFVMLAFLMFLELLRSSSFEFCRCHFLCQRKWSPILCGWSFPMCLVSALNVTLYS